MIKSFDFSGAMVSIPPGTDPSQIPIAANPNGDPPNFVNPVNKERIENDQPFEILAPENRYVFVSSQKHISGPNNAPDTVLSLQVASKQVLQPKYTMSGFNGYDRRGTEDVGFIKALRTLLNNNLPSILPNLRIDIENKFSEMHDTHKVMNGSKHSPVCPMIVQLIVLANSLAFFDEELAQNKEFMKSASSFIEDTLMTAETHDYIQWIMETAPKKNAWTGKRIVHKLMAIWFGSAHALSTTIKIERSAYAIFEKTAQGLPLLDSFIKEAARLTPVESMSTRRYALQPFTLSNGTTLEVGGWACTPVRAIMQNPEDYPKPL
ncbi:hypothetical protein DID88_006241 [Monilinia fructigena]|uniref:Uncharacterized protein n=1 Tax=Monilinia fructigena TaxID=38457 RepID=A0A395J2H8_9HELO|nr:hypothetical protein DID88_006241 [Monilinia fructigena]